jgi:DNA-binding MarR family transcriptional regulator
METMIEEQAVDILMSLMEFYHDKLGIAEKQGITGIQSAQLRLLYRLTQVPMISMSALGNMLYISKPYMTTMIDTLMDEELVERHPDLYDRRVINISITEKGRKKLELVRTQIRRQMQSVISNLPKSELEDLCSSGERLIDIVSKIK